MLFGQPQGYHRWDGSRFVLAPMPPGGLLASQMLEPSPELQKQAAVSHSSLLGSPSSDSGGDRGFGSPSGQSSSGEQQGSPGRGMSQATAGGLIGTGAGLATGLMGLGTIGSAVGGYNDAKGINADLSAIGHGDKSVSQGAAAVSSALMGIPDALGLFGAKTDLAGLDLGLSRQGLAELAAFSNGYNGLGLTGYDSVGMDAAYGPQTPAYEGPMTLEAPGGSYGVGGLGMGGIGAGASGPLGDVAGLGNMGYGAVGSDSSSSSGPKIVCTAMCEAYGFGSFRQKIWLAQSRDLAPEYQAGYHALFLPLVRLAYRGKVRWLRRALEHIARHRTADIWKQRKGKRDWIGAVERAILEPLCYAAGWIRGCAAGRR
jgi:hypothetical protein